MRKYQQLLLVLISILSISVLLMYKSENKRLKYVLQVVNFFGRSDAAVMARLENSTNLLNSPYDFTNPLPVWQRIGDNFYAFSTFWAKNELVAGGEISSIVVGIKFSIINFKCEISYKEGSLIVGKFGFIRIDTAEVENEKNSTEAYAVYKFLCKVSRDFGVPENLILTDTKTKIKHELSLRHAKNREVNTKSLLTACVNLVPYNATQSSKKYLTHKNLVQFFIHHQAIGIDEFLIYNGDTVDAATRRFLFKTGIRLNFIPYNFPFDYKNAKTRTIIETDCLMRNFNSAEFTILLEPNEFLFPSTNVQFKGSVIRSLRHYDKDINRFEIPGFSVCLDHRNKLLMDNTLYDPEVRNGHTLYVYKSTLHTDRVKSMLLYVARIFSHTYMTCASNKDLLYDWRNSIREDFMQYIETLRNQIDFLL